MRFNFKAKDQNGKVREGKIEAIDQNSAVQALQKNKYIPISVIEEKEASALLKSWKKTFSTVKPSDLMVMFRQLSIMIEAKVPVVASLEAIEEQTENRYLRFVIHEIKGDVEDGMPLSESLFKHQDVFSPLVINMIRAGEISGNLQKSISYVAENIEKNYQLTSKIRGALFYPAFVVTVAGIIGFIVITVVLPRLTIIIKEMNVPIPWYTQAMISLGDFMAAYWWAVLVVILGIVGSVFFYARTEDGHKQWDRIQLKIPLIGKLVELIQMSRFSENLSVLLNGGIPIVQALLITGGIVGNSVYRSIILRASDEVKTGGTMSVVFARSVEIPSIMTRMIKVGEETGKLSEVLKKVANFYNAETDQLTKNITVLVEPILIVFLGIGVAIMVFAILMPIYDIVGKIQ